MQNYRQVLARPRQMSGNLHKLVFIYPMLFTNDLSKHSNLLRDFLAISMNKQLFIENVLNIVDMAPQVGNDNNNSDVYFNMMQQMLGNQIIGAGGQGRGIGIRKISTQTDKYSYEQKLQEKIVLLKKLLKNDPQLSKLRPHMEILTLQNLIDIPVITGTQMFPIDGSLLTLILLVSMGTSTPLNSYSNFQKVFTIMRGLNPEKLHAILTNVEQDFMSSPHKYNLYNIFGALIRHSLSGLKNFFSGHKLTKSNEKTSVDALKKQDLEKLVSYIRDNLNQIETMFKLVLDPRLIYSMFGLKSSTDMTTKMTKVISPQLKENYELFKSNLISTFNQFLTPLLRSAGIPLLSLDSDLNLNNLKEDIFDYEFMDKLESWMNKEFWVDLKNTLDSIQINIRKDTGELSSSNEQFIKTYKKICDKDIPKQYMSDFISKYHDLIQPNIIRTQIIDYDTLVNFLNGLDQFHNEIKSMLRFYEKYYSLIFKNFEGVFEKVYNLIRDTLSEYFNQIRRNSQNKEQLYTIGFTKEQINKYQTQLEEVITDIIRITLYVALQTFLCDAINIYDAELEVEKARVTDLPNYALVFPVEITIALHSVMVAANWRSYINSQIPSDYVINLNDNYIKGIVKFINKRIKVPNIIIVDENKNNIYYQFMFMDKVNNTNISTIESYIKANQEVEVHSSNSNLF